MSGKLSSNNFFYLLVGMIDTASDQSDKEGHAESEPPPSPGGDDQYPSESREQRSSSRSPERSESPQRRGDADLQQQDMDVSD